MSEPTPGLVYVLETADGRVSSIWATEGEADQCRRLATDPSTYRVTPWTVLGDVPTPAGEEGN